MSPSYQAEIMMGSKSDLKVSDVMARVAAERGKLRQKGLQADAEVDREFGG